MSNSPLSIVRRYLRTFLITSLSLALPAHAADPDVGDDMMGLLDSNVVSGASKTAEKADSAPATTSSISSADFKRYGITNLQEAINFFSLGLVAERTDDTQVGGRGLAFATDGDNHVLVLIDGHMINDGRGGGVNFVGFGVPFEMIDHIEFIVGPGSVLFGSYAMLGVINIVTKDAKSVSGLTVTAKGTTSAAQDRGGGVSGRLAGYGLNGRLSAVAGNDHVLLGQPLEWVAGGEFFGDRLPARELSDGRSTDGNTRLGDAYARVRWGDFELRGKYSNNSHTLPMTADSDFTKNTYKVDESVFADLVWRHDLSTRVSLSARGYFDVSLQHIYTRSATAFWAPYLPAGYTDPSVNLLATAFSRWGGAEAQVNVDWLGDGRFPLMAGIDGRVISIENPESFSALSGTALTHENRISKTDYVVAPYLQQRFRLGSTFEGNLGARLDTQSAASPHVSPRAALVWTAPWEGKLKAVVSSAFRSPTGAERFFALPGLIELNPDLKPETVVTGELSHEQRFGRQRLLVGGFYNHYDSLIQYGSGVTPNTVMERNSGAFENVGANGTFEGAAGGFRYGLNVTGAALVNHVAYGMAPSVFGNARIGYEFGPNGPTVSLIASVYGPRLATNALTSMPASSDLRATVYLPKLGHGFDLRVSVGGSTNPSTALVASTTPTSVELTPNTQRLYLSLELGWSTLWASAP